MATAQNERRARRPKDPPLTHADGRCCRRVRALRLIGGAVLSVFAFSPATADKIKHPIAVFSGLDKITGRIITFEIATNETVQFGSLQITERVCYSRPPTEAPQTDSFLEVDAIDANNESKRVFTGWMFADSPSLHALDHPVYDIWLLRCKGDGPLISEAPPEQPAFTPVAPAVAAKPFDSTKPFDSAKPYDSAKARNRRAAPATVDSQALPPPPSATAAPAAEANGTNPGDPGAPLEVGPPPGFVPPGGPSPTGQHFGPANPPQTDNGLY